MSGQPGAPLQLALQVIRAGDCATLANARVDVWHADALGLYSGYENQSGVGVSMRRKWIAGFWTIVVAHIVLGSLRQLPHGSRHAGGGIR